MDGTGLEVDDIEGLLKVEGARLSVGVESSPIVESEGGIAGLLDFGDDESGAEGVDGPGGDEEALVGFRFDDVHGFEESILIDETLEVRAGEIGLEAGVEFCAGFGVEDVPGFGFAEIG